MNSQRPRKEIVEHDSQHIFMCSVVCLTNNYSPNPTLLQDIKLSRCLHGFDEGTPDSRIKYNGLIICQYIISMG